MRAETRATAPTIEVEGLSKIYGEKSAHPVHALRGVSFVVPRGDFVAIMGHSGSGKSMLLNLLGCLDTPTAGSYRLDGADVSRKSRRQLAQIRSRTLGFVFQSYQLLPRLTIRDNCALPLQYASGVRGRERRIRAEEVLARVGLEEKFERRPAELSGGQQQRVAIARALVNRPSLLLADEPTGNLDSRTGLQVLGLLQRLHEEGLTIALVTHDAEVAACARRIIRMRDGVIEAIDLNGAPVDARKLFQDQAATILALQGTGVP